MNIPFHNARVALERVNRFFDLVPEENYESLLRSSEYYRLLIEIHRAEIDRAPALPDREGDSFWLSPSAGLSAGLTDASLGMEERRRVGLSSAS